MCEAGTVANPFVSSPAVNTRHGVPLLTAITGSATSHLDFLQSTMLRFLAGAEGRSLRDASFLTRRTRQRTTTRIRKNIPPRFRKLSSRYRQANVPHGICLDCSTIASLLELIISCVIFCGLQLRMPTCLCSETQLYVSKH